MSNSGAGAPSRCLPTLTHPVPPRHRPHSSPVLFFRRLPRKSPEMRFSPGTDIPRSPFPRLCQHPRPPPVPHCGAARKHRAGPGRGGHGGTAQPYRGSGGDNRSPTGTSVCLCRGSAAHGSPHPRPRCGAAADGQFVLVAFKMVQIEVFSVTGLGWGLSSPRWRLCSQRGQPDPPHPGQALVSLDRAGGTPSALFRLFLSLRLFVRDFFPLFHNNKNLGVHHQTAIPGVWALRGKAKL